MRSPEASTVPIHGRNLLREGEDASGKEEVGEGLGWGPVCKGLRVELGVELDVERELTALGIVVCGE